MLFGKVRLNQSISWLCFDVEDNFMQPVSYVFKTTSYYLLLWKWYRTDGVIVSVPMIAVIGVVETSTPERQTSPPFVSSPIQLNQMRDLSKKTVKFCQFFLSLEYLMFSNFKCFFLLSTNIEIWEWLFSGNMANVWKSKMLINFLNLGSQRWLSNVSSVCELPTDSDSTQFGKWGKFSSELL